jgi:hypothetical protein
MSDTGLNPTSATSSEFFGCSCMLITSYFLLFKDGLKEKYDLGIEEIILVKSGSTGIILFNF